MCAIAIGLLICLFRSRQGKSRRESDASSGEKEDYKTTRIASLFQAADTSAGVEAPKARQFFGIPGNPGQKHWSLWRMAMRKDDPASSDVPLPNGESHVAFEASPVSVQSYQTTSQLLPDKPSLAVPLPAGAASRSKPKAMATPKSSAPKQPVRFDDNIGLRVITPTPPPSDSASSIGGSSWHARNTSHGPLQSQTLRHQLSDPFIDKSESAALLPSSSDGRRASTKDLPRIIMPDARSGAGAGFPPQDYQPQHYHDFEKQQHGIPPVPLLYHSEREAGETTPFVSPRPDERLNASDFKASSLAAAASSQRPFPSSHQPSLTSSLHNSASSSLQHPSEDPNSYFSKYRPIQRASKSMRPLTHYTTGSDTSFEDDGETPPEGPVSALSPVAESPAGPSRAAPRAAPGGLPGLVYPPVPGSTASAKRLQVTPPRAAPGSTSAAAAGYMRSIAAAAAANYKSPVGSSYSRWPAATGPPAGPVPLEMPDSSPEPAEPRRSAQSPRSPNFSRPQRPDEYPGVARASSAPKWQVVSSPGLDGSQETWASPIAGRQDGAWQGAAARQQPPRAGAQPQQQRQDKPPLRSTVGQARAEQRGPWRGREPPIGSQWRHG